jgi:hypothetical protein
VFHAGMMRRHLDGAVRLAALLVLLAAAGGCLAPLHKGGVALSEATAPVVDQAAAAYRDANAIHDLRVDYDAVARFDEASPVYNPRNTESLLSEKDIEARVSVLAAFQEYANLLVAISSGTDSPALQAASRSVGENLTTFANSLTPPHSAGSSPAITPEARNGISTAVDALGQFLVNRKIKKELPQAIVAMDPHVQSLCSLLEGDVQILEEQERSDYNRIIDQQTLFIRENTKMDPEQRRVEIMKLPGFVRQQRTGEARLESLRAAVNRLATAHRALAAEAQGRNAESLADKLAELASAGVNLGNFYQSLPAK